MSVILTLAGAVPVITLMFTYYSYVVMCSVNNGLRYDWKVPALLLLTRSMGRSQWRSPSGDSSVDTEVAILVRYTPKWQPLLLLSGAARGSLNCTLTQNTKKTTSVRQKTFEYKNVDTAAHDDGWVWRAYRESWNKARSPNTKRVFFEGKY